MSNLYSERDIIEQGDHYSRHTSAMTGEGLHSKSDIAAELAHRDIEIERLQARVSELYSALDNVNERLADGCRLSGDEIDDVDAALLNTDCKAFILRKQAEAVEAFVDWVKPHWPTSIAIQIADDSRSYVFELRNEAGKAGGGDE